MFRHFTFGFVGIGTIAGFVSASHAAVQGLYLFDTISNPTPDEAPYEILEDSSGNNLHIVKQELFGAVALTTNRPAVMPAGTFALDSVAGGTGSLITGTTNKFSHGLSGQGLTVEFWYNPETTNTPLNYIAEYGNEGANGWDIWQTANAGQVTIHGGFRNSANVFTQMNSPVLASNDWSHIAMTYSPDGTTRLYVNGAQVASANVPGAVGTANSFFRLSAGFNATFSNIAMFDELRISDVALLPGNGTGVGELSHNASLVPEPASLAVVGTAVITALAIRRRRA